MRFIGMAGLLQRIEETVDKDENNNPLLPRNQILEGGSATLQDHGALGEKGESAHIVQVTIKEEARSELKKYPELLAELEDFVGHTQVQPKKLNDFLEAFLIKFKQA